MKQAEIQLSNPRYFLSEIVIEDVDQAVQVLNDPNVGPMLITPPYPFRPEHWTGYVASLSNESHIVIQDAVRYSLVCAIRDRENHNQFIGSIAFVSKDDPTIGYYLSSDKHNQGIMTAALQAFASTLQPILGWKVLHAQANFDNPASQKVLERFGMRQVQEIMGADRYGQPKLIYVYEKRF